MGAELGLLGAGWPAQVVALGKAARQVWWAPDTRFFFWHICKIIICLFLVRWVFVAALGLSLLAILYRIISEVLQCLSFFHPSVYGRKRKVKYALGRRRRHLGHQMNSCHYTI